MSRTTQVLCLMLLLAYQGAYATKTDIQVIQPFPSFISVQENHSKDFDMSDYFAGFNLTFSLLPNKITESANVAPKTISAYKAVVPITRGPAFNRSHVIATYAALKEDNTLRIIDTTMEDHFYGDVMFWEVKLPVLEQDTCFDVSNALNNIIWVDCQNSTHNFILLLEFSSAQVYNTKQIIVTERVSDIDSSPLKRQLSFSDANASSEVQSVYRFIAKADGKFMIEEFVYINAMGRVQAGPVRTAANYTKLKDFTPRSLIAFKNFVMLVGKSKEVALGSVSEDNFKIQTLFNDDAEIESAQAHMLTGSFYFLLFSHAGKLTGFYLSGPSKTVLSNNITFPAVDTESYISHTVIDGFIAALSRKKGSGNSLLTMYADTDAKEIDVYYHNELQHKVGQSESGWIFPVGGNYLVAVTKDSVEVFLHYPQILSVDHRLAWDLIDFGELEVKSTYYDQVLTREFDMELHYYRENDTSIGERKDSIKYVNLMYPDYFRVPIWQYAYGPALRLDLQTKFPHTLVKDQDKVNVSLSDKAPNLAKALNGSLTFVEFKTVDMNGDLEYYLLVQNKEYFYTAICDLDHQYNLTTQNLNCSDLAEPFQIEGEVSTVLTDHPNFNLVEETVMYPNTRQLLKVYTKDFKYLIKTITIEEDDDSDLSNFCSELLYDASTHEYLCVKRFQGEVLKLNFTGTTPHDSNVAESVFNAENCSLKSIHKIRLSAYYPNYYFIQTEHKVAIIEKKKLFEVGSFDFSSNLTTTNFEYFIMLDKIVAISYEDQKIIEIFFAKKDFKHEETRSVALFGYHIDLSHKLWDTLNSDGNFYFQGKNAYGERALLVYDFSLDPNHHPLRAIIPLEKPKNDYGYYLRIAQGDSFSIALVMDSQQAEKYSFKLVYTLPVVYVTTNQTGYNADEFEKPYDVKLIVSSPLTRQTIDLSFTLFLTVTQRTITVKPNANITQLNNPPAKGKYCAPFNAHDIFEGTVFSVNISNSAQGIDYSPRVTASFPTYQEINKIFTTSITHIRKITMGHKYIHLVSVKELYKFTVEPGLPAGFNQGKEIITLPDDGYSHYWDQLVVSSDESHVVLGAPFYNGSFFLLKVTGKETKSAVLQDSNTVLLAISSDNMLFAVSSPNYYNFSSSDAFISYFDLTDISKLGEFSIASVIAKNALNFNKSEILAFDVYSQNAHSTDLVILDKSQGLIICHLDLFKTQLACEAINITIYVEGDMPGVTPIWKFMKLVKTTQDGSDTIFKVLVSARNYHSYLFSITKSENFSLNIRVEKGFMHYYQYSDTSFMTANEKFFVALTTIPNTNVHKETSEYLYFYDLISANSSTNINWRQYPLIDAFQREKVGDSKVDITMAMGMSAAIDTVFTASYFNGYFNMYKVGTEHQLCVAKAEDVDSKTSFRITATNDYSKAYMDYNLGKKWDEADPDGTGPRATSGGKFWYVMMWIAIFLGVVAGVYFVAKKLKERKGIVRLEGQLNDPVYQEL